MKEYLESSILIPHMTAKPSLISLSMVICDTVIDDRRTGKKSLVGLFNNITSSVIPCVHPRLNVFVSLTEGNGDYVAKLRCLKVGDEKEIFFMEGPVRFSDPRQILEFNFEILGIAFPDYGDYRFEFLCNDVPIIARKFRVSQNKQNREKS